MEQMSIEHARLKLGDVVDLARLANQPTTITRQGKPAAAVIPMAWLNLQRFGVGMCEIKCPDCEATCYPADLGEAIDRATRHKCDEEEF